MIQTWLYLVLVLTGSEWGFFGHRLINRLAVYTVPTEALGWYKPYIDYLSDHAVDPDKRRYASKHEAVRHYIDLDHWGDKTFDHVPHYWDQVLALNVVAYALEGKDTLFFLKAIPPNMWSDSSDDRSSRLQLVRNHYLRQYYEEVATIPCDSLQMLFPGTICNGNQIIYLHDVFTQHGIVPYHLQVMLRRLTSAFKSQDIESILRISAEFGHYIADACVPLHTTTNYNGQLTNQVGIHGFWESRIPELFAIDEFDMVVGTATYIDNPVNYFWGIVLDSHKEVERVLSLEKELSLSYPSDQQYCMEDRMSQNVRTQCADYAKAYHLAMDKMVEDRFRVAVKAVGSVWYTAWVDAGQPTPPPYRAVNKRNAEDDELDKALQSGKGEGREHE